MPERIAAKSRYDIYFDEVMDAVKENQETGKSIPRKLLMQALELQGFSHQHFANLNHQHSMQQLKEANISNDKAAKTHGKKLYLVLSALSAAASIVGGSLGIANGTKLITISGQIPKGLGAIGTGTQTVASIPHGIAERDRTLHQYMTNLLVEALREQRRAAQESGQRSLQAINLTVTLNDKNFQAIQQILSAR